MHCYLRMLPDDRCGGGDDSASLLADFFKVINTEIFNLFSHCVF